MSKQKLQVKILIIVLIIPFRIFSEEPLFIDIDEAEVIGITNSIILTSLKERKEVFKMVAKEKWRNYFPRFGLSYFGLKNNSLNQTDSAYNDIRLQLNQLLYDGGESLLEIESAKLQELLNHEDFQIVKEKLALEIRKAFVRVLANRYKAEISNVTFERIKILTKDYEKEWEKGFISDQQKWEIESRIRDLELSDIKIQNSVRQSEMELKILLNLPIDTMIRPKSNLLFDYILKLPDWDSLDRSLNLEFKPELKKSRIAIENLKIRKDISEGYWKPKVFLGGYYGQNVNGPLPVKNEVYGFNLSVQTQIGSTTSQNVANYGVQSEGSGIQRIPGFGPQNVGRGENAFNSSTLNFLEDLSYSRKIYEQQIALADAIRNKNLMEIQLESALFKSKEKLKESWYVLRIVNSKFLATYDLWKSNGIKKDKGFIKYSEWINSEHEMLKAIDELSIAFGGYLESGFELSFNSGISKEDLGFYHLEKGQGNSILMEIIKSQSSNIPFFRGDFLKSKNEYSPEIQKKQYEPFGAP